jgi:hypothetical protein
VTGAPNARTMALIRELEGTPARDLLRRDRLGRAALRTGQGSLQSRGPHHGDRPPRKTAVYGTGSGITWSSDPAV